MMLTTPKLKDMLDRKYIEYNNTRFIEHDPICVPHRFCKPQDIEIAAFFAAILAWGNRKTIIQSANRILSAMDESPYDFLMNHEPTDLKRFEHFVHRTFNSTDLLYFIDLLSRHYQHHSSLQTAFKPPHITAPSMQDRLTYFHQYFFEAEHPARTRKHIATPQRKSACKRLNMFLRWMVRKDNQGVDFGLWTTISPAHLICPLDVHVGRVAFKLGLIESNKADWQTALTLTQVLSRFDPMDPVKYDYALFGMGVEEKIR